MCICVTWRGRTICMLIFDSKESILQSRRSRNHSSGWDWETAHKFLKDAKRVQHICSKATVSKVKFCRMSCSTQIFQNLRAVWHSAKNACAQRAHSAHRDGWKNENLKRARSWKNAHWISWAHWSSRKWSTGQNDSEAAGALALTYESWDIERSWNMLRACFQMPLFKDGSLILKEGKKIFERKESFWICSRRHVWSRVSSAGEGHGVSDDIRQQSLTDGMSPGLLVFGDIFLHVYGRSDPGDSREAARDLWLQEISVRPPRWPP
jgi:hypothetical protein